MILAGDIGGIRDNGSHCQQPEQADESWLGWQRMPVEVILNKKTALLGAAHYALLMQEGVV